LFQAKDFSKAPATTVSGTVSSPCWIVDLLKAAKATSSSSEAKRLIESGSVVLDGTTIQDFKAQVTWQPGDILQVGKKRIYKLN